MKTHLLLFILLLNAFGADAQPSQNSRAELPLQNDFTQYEVWPQSDSTVFVLTHENYVRRNTEPFILFKFGPDLSLLWQKPLQLPRGCKFLQATSDNKTLFLVFEGSRNDEYLLLRANMLNGTQIQTTHLLPENTTFNLTGIEVLQGKVFLSGLENERVTVLHLDPSRGLLLKLPAIYDQSTALAGFTADTVANRMEFILSESNGLISRLQVKRLAPDGSLFSTNFLQSTDRNYLTGILTPGDSSQKFIAGTYSLRDMRYPQGFYTGSFLASNSNQLQYHDFTTFTHFFDHLRPGRQEKLRRKVARFRTLNRTYFLRQRFLMHNMYPYKDGFILAGEQYYPQFEGEGAGNRVFSGYGFSQVVAAAFNKRGELLWENSFPLKNVQQFELKQSTAASVAGSKFIICYPDENLIRYKIISGSESSPNELVLRITPVLLEEKVLNTDLAGVAPWYLNHFLAFGEQKIRNSEGTRSVFFLNKISF